MDLSTYILRKMSGYSTKIIENGGCVVSEYYLDEEKDMANFPARNRIISGLALGVLVVEAPYRGGSTITAKHARLQGKKRYFVYQID